MDTCQLCGAAEDSHYDGVQCPIGPDTWSSTQVFTPHAPLCVNTPQPPAR